MAGLIAWAAKDIPFASGQRVLPHIANLHQKLFVERDGSATELRVEEVDPNRLDQEAEPLPATIVGRIAPSGEISSVRSSNGFRHQWPAVYTTARFEGDAIIVAFDDPVNRYRIQLDEGVGPVLQVVRPSAWISRLSGLGPGPHTIRVEKISESASSAGRFSGFYLPTGETALPPPATKARQIEFIGDSDTVGLGDMSETRDCEDYDVFLEATDTQKSFGPRVAAHFGADYQLIAASGVRLVHSDPEGFDRAMMDLYPRTMPDDTGIAKPDDWNPDLIVILIGSNDFAVERPGWHLWETKDLPANFQGNYLRFLRSIRARYPAAFVLVLTLGEYGPRYVSAFEEIVTARRSEGETRIDVLSLPDLERTACNWHPSLADHQRIADTVIRFVESSPEVWGKE